MLGSIELSQFLIPGRHSAIGDLIGADWCRRRRVARRCPPQLVGGLVLRLRSCGGNTVFADDLSARCWVANHGEWNRYATYFGQWTQDLAS